MKRISLLGSTGSIGKSTLDVVRHHKASFKIEALAARGNIELLEQQAREFNPSLIAVFDEESARNLQKRLPAIKVVSGLSGLEEAAALDTADFVMLAMSGNLGLQPALAAIEKRKQIGLANKEVLISAGALITRKAKEYGVQLLPVDSEHSALFQCLNGEKRSAVKKLIITASGGPFLHKTREELQKVSLQDALKHPNWSMGKKITIDSSTLMNKGLEVIEAHFLFDIAVENIEVAVHPESIIHSMIEFVDGSVIAQLSPPDMKLPIQYALTYPERMPSICPKMDFSKAFTLHFYPPDFKKFPCLDLAFQALRKKNSAPCFLNAANDVLVERFTKGEISWHQIGEKLERLFSLHQPVDLVSLEGIFSVDQRARELALRE
jgi:1-deoxy-D-xylulose-5-phosphate reductoisomerase